MAEILRVSLGQYSDKGRKAINQDHHGAVVPGGAQLSSKGIALALADGISSSQVAHVASESAVKSFLGDYYCTSEAWSVKTSAQRVVMATNSWLYAQTRQSPDRYDRDKGYVCTFSALVLKSRTAHLFHVGDSRIYRVQGASLEPLTQYHRVRVSEGQNYLSRALGIDEQLDIDYRTEVLDRGDVFVLATDGVHEHVDPAFVVRTIHGEAKDLDRAAQIIVEEAFRRGSPDNLTVQIVRVDGLPGENSAEVRQRAIELPLPPLLEARREFDGFRILRTLHSSSRSHIHLAMDLDTGQQVVLKMPSVDLQGDPAYLERFMMEEWIARRIHHPNVLRAALPDRARSALYMVMEYVEGQTLTQWMIDHPRPDLEVVRGIVEQIARGLQAFHRLEMVHQDLRPHNILIDRSGTVRIIDFGATRVAGIQEARGLPPEEILGTAQYTAPELFLGEVATARSDLFSLGVIAYQMLTGRLPYGTRVSQCRTRAAQKKLRYQSALDEQRAIPVWIDCALKKALEPTPYRRYVEPSEFVYDLRNPNPAFLHRLRPPLIERDPTVFWKGVSLGLLAVVIALLIALVRPI
ncbi:MAG: bifunctional protein-serine/threonine kinase/phosphatase [Zoogloeaceae bacterium]|nr:bifunctional protein-serine/threonine kinase/phosphatase [Zoogloeaceae bacterium]